MLPLDQLSHSATILSVHSQTKKYAYTTFEDTLNNDEDSSNCLFGHTPPWRWKRNNTDGHAAHQAFFTGRWVSNHLTSCRRWGIYGIMWLCSEEKVTQQKIYIHKRELLCGSMYPYPFHWPHTLPQRPRTGLKRLMLGFQAKQSSVWMGGRGHSRHTCNNVIDEVYINPSAQLGRNIPLFACLKTRAASSRSG